MVDQDLAIPALWVMVIIAAVRDDDALIGYALGLGVVAVVVAIIVGVRRRKARKDTALRILTQGRQAQARILKTAAG